MDETYNSLTVEGNMMGTSPRSAYVYGFMSDSGQVYGYIQNAADNIVPVSGNMISKTNARQALLAGFGSGMTDGKNNTVVVSGDMICKSQMLGVFAFVYRNKKEKDRDDEIFK